jgi:hypothetical protein
LYQGGYSQYYRQVSNKFTHYTRNQNNTRGIFTDSSTGKVYFVGEHYRYGDTVSDAILEYDINTDTIRSLLQLPANGNLPAFAKFGGKMYLGGGTNYTTDYNHFVHLLYGDSAGWDTVLMQPNGHVACLYSTAGKLYAAGAFTSMSGVTYNKIAVFDGQTWQGLTQNNHFDEMSTIKTVLNYKGMLYAAGTIVDSFNTQMFQLARYNGHNWEAVPGWKIGINSYILNMCVYKDILYVAGYFYASDGTSLGNCIAGFDGQNWFSPGIGANNVINAMCVMGDKLYVSGGFDFIGGIRTNCVAAWDGQQWCSIDSALIELGFTWCGAANDKLFITGGFRTIGTDSFYRHAVWTGVNHTDTCGYIYSDVEANEVQTEIVCKLYPNPATHQLTIQTTGYNSSYQLTTTTGQLLLQGNVTQPNFTIDVSILPPGLYFVQLTNGQQRAVRKFVKQ